MNMKKTLLQSQLERVYPLVIARELLKRSRNPQEDKIKYSTLSLQRVVWQDAQRDILDNFQKKGLIEIHSQDEESKEGGEIYSIRVLDTLQTFYASDENFNAFTSSSEMSIAKMAESFMSYLQGKESQFGKKDLQVFDDEMTHEEINPYLAALYLELKKIFIF